MEMIKQTTDSGVRLRAWTAHDGDEGWEIVFAVDQTTASKLAAQSLDVEDFEDELDVVASPHFDKFAESGSVPPRELIKHDWHFECSGCGEPVGKDSYMEDRSGEFDPDVFTYVGAAVYCSAACKENEDACKLRIAAKKEELAKAVHEAMGGLTITLLHALFEDGPYVARFTFEGAKHGGAAELLTPDAELRWSMANIDVEAWEAHKKAHGADRPR